jgi:gamma-glutamyltranspeptidase/glutathione hydrolase
MAPVIHPPLVPVRAARGSRGAVVAPHHLATAAGLAVLRDGGSAVDAAIAANAVLAVVMPNGCGLGGDAFWLVWDAREARLVALNGSGAAGRAVDPDALVARGWQRLPRRGPWTVTVPGAVASWGEAHRRWGRRPWASLLAPAIELAEEGYPAWDEFIAAVERTAALLTEEGEAWTTGFGQVFRPHGRPWRLGERVRLPALAATLKVIATGGAAAFYRGELADRQARFLAAAGSPLTREDLEGHRSRWEEPVTTTYRGVTVATHPPNASGIVALELLNILETVDPPHRAAFGHAGVEDPQWVHLAVEAARLAWEDRNRYLADPAFHPVPVDQLVDKGYAARLAETIDRRWTRSPAPIGDRDGETVFLAVVDGEGNGVSLIQSNYAGFGSGLVDPATGIHYQNRGTSFRLDPDHPNRLAPGKRPLHTLIPAVLLRDGQPWVFLGSMGGEAQPQILAQLVSNLVDGGLDVAWTVAVPRWFAAPADPFGPLDAVLLEPRLDPAVVEGLRRRGHRVELVEPFDPTLGQAHAIELVDGGPGAGGTLAAATDPRSAGLPAVW